MKIIILGATKMDRPEWIAIDQGARTVYPKNLSCPGAGAGNCRQD
jgi:secreted PhoX family phosphatase